MGTKADPGKYDCYVKLELDEPFFVLMARDLTAPHLVKLWRAMCAKDFALCNKILEDAFDELSKSNKSRLSLLSEKSIEALDCAKAMKEWFERNKS